MESVVNAGFYVMISLMIQKHRLYCVLIVVRKKRKKMRIRW